ncbi:hypothetical protein E4U55_007632 [Claviceps digitariae]|nr:hypothetical protein E4U55_007632 [Claviceps digitariae]
MSGTQIVNNDENGAMQFTSNHWETGYASSTNNEAVQQRPFAIQRYSIHSDDPYVASGIIPASRLMGNQQATYAADVPNLQQMGLPQSVIQQLTEHAANYVDSGYGGSHLSYGDSSPSNQTVKTEEAHNLKCTHCEHEAKNNSELRKHINRHNKPHKCGFRNCTKGFATQNDLDRHKRTVHRKEYLDKGNTILYECLHCKDRQGKSNARKKTEWPRKDNFLAHLDRIHHIRYRPSDNLDQYVIRVQHSSEDLIENMTGIPVQAQHLSLQGIGTGADVGLTGTNMGTGFTNDLSSVDQVHDAYQDQRLSMLMYRNSRVLSDTDLLGFSPQEEIASQDILESPENDLDAMDASLHIAHGDERLQQPLAQPLVQSDHQANSDATSLIIPWRIPNQSEDDVPMCEEIEEYVSNDLQDSSSNANVMAMASQNQPELTATSLHTMTNEDFMFTLGRTHQPCFQWAESEDILRLIKNLPREILQAALDSRAPESDEGYVAELHPRTSKSPEHLCRHWDAEFWCGFCVKYVEVDRDDSIENAWSQRVNHIDAHFCGKGTLVKQSIEEWTYEDDKAVRSQGFLMDETPPFTSIAMSQTASTMSASQKRLASSMESESPGPKRTKSKWVKMWQCQFKVRMRHVYEYEDILDLCELWTLPMS